MISESKTRAPTIVRHRTAEQIESGQRLQRDMEAIDALEAKNLADQLRADEEVRRVADERAVLEEMRRATSAAGRYMDEKYNWVNNPTKG
jgi:hypothetical protein